MGFDIYGTRRRSERGRHFGINGSWWGDLASYILDVCSDLFRDGEATESWFVNEGQRVSSKTAKAIAARLQELLQSGAVKQYLREHSSASDSFTEEIVKEFAEFCDSSGGFEIW